MRISVFVTAVAAFLAVSFLVFQEMFAEWLEGDAGLQWLESWGSAAGPIAVGLLLIDVLLPIPGTAIMTALGQLLGPWLGSLYGAVGTFGAGLTGYGLVRAMGPAIAARMVGADNLDRLRGFFDRWGAFSIAGSRVIPIVPEVLCCLAGLSPMPLGRFALSLAAGCIPVAFACAAFGAAGREEPWLTLAIAVVVPFLLLAPAWWLVRRNWDRSGSAGD